jgi:hypothetical protein
MGAGDIIYAVSGRLVVELGVLAKGHDDVYVVPSPAELV